MYAVTWYVLMSSGQLAPCGFASSILCAAHESHPLRTADTEQKILSPVATERIVSAVRFVCWGQGLDEVSCMLR